MLQQRHNAPIFIGCTIIAIFGLGSPGTLLSSIEEQFKGRVMTSTKAIATLASVTVIAGGLFAFSWVSLALLGF